MSYTPQLRLTVSNDLAGILTNQSIIEAPVDHKAGVAKESLQLYQNKERVISPHLEVCVFVDGASSGDRNHS